jgi:hypothetical protein
MRIKPIAQPQHNFIGAKAAAPETPRSNEMRREIGRLIVAASIGLASAAGTASAQSPFDPKTFFDELQRTGAKLPVTFDAQKFFEDLQLQGARTGAFSPEKFFEELQRNGATLPVAFDAQRFFEELQRNGARVPPIVMLR